MYCRVLYNRHLNPKIDTKLQYELLFTFHSSKKQHGGQTCLVKFLFRHFKQEDIFYVLQDHQCIQALDAVTSSGILKAKQKLGVTFNSNKKQHGGQTCLVKFLFRHFKQEDIFYVLQDHQCIQALPLGLKMPMLPTQ